MRLPNLSLFLFLAAQWARAASGTAGSNYQLSDPTAFIKAVAVDAAGNMYLTGDTASLTFPTTPGVFQPNYGGGQCNPFAPVIPPPSGICDQAFVAKLDPTGAVLWATYLSGHGPDNGQAIAVDPAGNVYVAGITAPFQQAGGVNDFPTTPGSAFPSAPETVGAAFVVKLNPAGTRMLYGTFIPDYGSSVAMSVDADGNAYVASQIEPAVYQFPTTAGAFQTSSSAQETGVIVKLNSSGALVYATYLGGSQEVTLASAIAVDALGNAYVTGLAPSQFPTTPGAYETISSGGAFAAKLNASGSGLIYSTFLGAGFDNGLAIKVDSQGRAYVLGQVECVPACQSTDSSGEFQTTPGAFESANAPLPPWVNPTAVNQFLASLSADGSALVYGTYISGALVLDVDASGDAYVAGLVVGSGFPVTAGAFEPCYNSNDFAAEFSPTGAVLGATYFGAPGTFSLTAIAVGPNGQVSIGTGPFVDNLLIDDPQEPPGQCVSPIVQNAANYYSYGTQIAPGELVTLQGVGIGPETGAQGSPGANGLLPTNLAGVQVFFGQFAAPLMYVQSGQINAQAPWEIAGQASTQVQVIYNGTPMNTFSLSVVNAAPGLFYLSYPARQAAVLNADGSVNSVANPAEVGDVISLFGTGAGPTNPAGVTGGIWGPGPGTLLTLPVTVQIEGINAPVVYAGAAPGLLSGFFQVDVQVPPGAAPFPIPVAGVNLYLGLPGTILGETVNQATVAVVAQ